MRTRRSVSRESFAFVHFPRAFHNSALRLSSEDEFDPGISAFVIEEPPFGTPRPFELQVEVDVPALARQAGIPAQAVSLSVILESQELKHDQVLETWGADEVPTKWSGAIPANGFGERRSTLVLVCHLNQTRSPSLSVPWRAGSVLARRAFSVSLPAHASLFQVSWESFASMGWDSKALWHVEFKETEGFHEINPEDAVALYANKDLPAFHRLLAPGASRNPKLSVTSKIVLKMVASMMAADVTIPVLADLHRSVRESLVIVDEVDGDTLAGKILGLVSLMHLDPIDAMRLASDEPNRMRERIQGMLEVGDTLDQRALDRILSS